MLSCGSQVGPEPNIPWLEGDAQVLRDVLEDLESLHQTPLASAARRALSRIEGCDGQVHTESAALDLDALIEGLSCRDSKTGDAEPDDALRFELPLPALEGGALKGHLTSPASGPKLILELPEPGDDHPWSWWLPDDDGRPPRLQTREALLHGVWQSRHGLDFASWVEAGSELDTLWGLKADLLSRAVLNGAMEWVIFLPPEGRAMPDMVAALGIRNRQAALNAAAGLAEQLAETWSVRRTPLRMGSAEGMCLEDLRLLPELSPCFVVTQHQWLLGWNRASLERALSAHRSPADDERSPSSSVSGNSLEVAWHLFPEADRRIQEALGVDGDETLTYPWQRLTVDARHRESAYEFQLDFESTEGAP